MYPIRICTLKFSPIKQAFLLFPAIIVSEGSGRHEWRTYLFPFLARVRVLRYFFALANVDGNISRIDATLKHAHLWVLSSAPEQPWRLHSEIAYLQKELTFQLPIALAKLRVQDDKYRRRSHKESRAFKA